MTHIRPANEKLFNDAKRHIAGGVNSPVRAFAGVGVCQYLSSVQRVRIFMIPKITPILTMLVHGVR